MFDRERFENEKRDALLDRDAEGRKKEDRQMSKYAIVSDRTPNRCTIKELIETDGDMLDISRDRDIPLSRIMWVADGSTVGIGDRAWHRDDTIQ